mgnify:CR=1 FL=1
MPNETGSKIYTKADEILRKTTKQGMASEEKKRQHKFSHRTKVFTEDMTLLLGGLWQLVTQAKKL